MNSWVIASWFLFASLLFCYFLYLGCHIKMRRTLDRVSFGGRGLGGDPSPYGCCPSPSKNIPPHVVNQIKIASHVVQFQVIPLDCCGGTTLVGLRFIHCFILTITICSWSVSPVSWSVYSI